MILFTKPDCQKCQYIKEKVDLDKLGVKVMELNKDNAEALGELAWHEGVRIAEKELPILVTPSGGKILKAINIKNYLLKREKEMSR